MDVAKGLGIIFVVYGHALRGFWAGHAWPAWSSTQDNLIYSFHMPLFFMVAGLFLWKSLERSRLAFVRSRWWAIVYPYFLWSLICAGLEVAASRFANTPLALQDLLLIPFKPIEQFWFLYALLIAQMIAVICFPSKTVLILATIFGLAFTGLSQSTTILQVSLRFLPYLALGVCAACPIKRLWSAGQARQFMAFVTSWAAFGLIYAFEQWGPWHAVLLGSFGALGSVSAAMLIAQSPAASALAVLGRASMAIYVSHTLFSAGTRAGFVVLNVDRYAVWTLIPEFLTGLLLPLPLWFISTAIKRGYLLGFGVGPSVEPHSESKREISSSTLRSENATHWWRN